MTYLWRDIDPALWQRVKVKAKAENLNLRELMVKLVTDWIDGDSSTPSGWADGSVDPTGATFDVDGVTYVVGPRVATDET